VIEKILVPAQTRGTAAARLLGEIAANWVAVELEEVVGAAISRHSLRAGRSAAAF